MLPNTSLIAPSSILIRVGSFNAIAASTETPSRASTRCSADAVGGLIAVSAASSHGLGSSLANAIIELLELLELDAVSGVVEADDVLFLDVGGAGPVDEGRKPPLEANRQRIFVGNE